MTIIITRNGLWLNERYGWGIIPHLFPAWQAGDVLEMALSWTDKPTGYAVVNPGVIDLDAVKVERI